MTTEELIILVHKESLDYFKDVDSPFDITRRNPDKVKVRQVTYYVLCQLHQTLGFLKGISSPFEKYFKQDHSTLVHSKKKISDYLSYDKNIIRNVKELKERCKEKIKDEKTRIKIKEDLFEDSLHKINLYNLQEDIIEFVNLKIKKINDTQINTEEVGQP